MWLASPRTDVATHVLLVCLIKNFCKANKIYSHVSSRPGGQKNTHPRSSRKRIEKMKCQDSFPAGRTKKKSHPGGPAENSFFGLVYKKMGPKVYENLQIILNRLYLKMHYRVFHKNMLSLPGRGVRNFDHPVQ